MDPDFDTRSLRVADTHPEDLVAWFEVGYLSANGFNQASHINAWPANVYHNYGSPDVRHAFQFAQVERI